VRERDRKRKRERQKGGERERRGGRRIKNRYQILVNLTARGWVAKPLPLEVV